MSCAFSKAVFGVNFVCYDVYMQKLILRKNPIAVLKKVFVIGVILLLLHSSIAILGEASTSLNFVNTANNKLTLTIVIVLLEVVVALYFFLRWLTHVYEVHPESIVEKRGILIRKKEIHLLENAQNLSIQQGILGNIFNYGTIQIFNPFSKLEVSLKGITDVQEVSHQIQLLISARLTNAEAPPSALK